MSPETHAPGMSDPPAGKLGAGGVCTGGCPASTPAATASPAQRASRQWPSIQSEPPATSSAAVCRMASDRGAPGRAEGPWGSAVGSGCRASSLPPVAAAAAEPRGEAAEAAADSTDLGSIACDSLVR